MIQVEGDETCTGKEYTFSLHGGLTQAKSKVIRIPCCLFSNGSHSSFRIQINNDVIVLWVTKEVLKRDLVGAWPSNCLRFVIGLPEHFCFIRSNSVGSYCVR